MEELKDDSGFDEDHKAIKEDEDEDESSENETIRFKTEVGAVTLSPG